LAFGGAVGTPPSALLEELWQPFGVVDRSSFVNDTAIDFVGSFPTLHAVAYRASFAVLGHRDDARDCAQEALARALLRWNGIADHAQPWVARVATNLALDSARSHHRRAGRTAHDAVDTPARIDPVAEQRHDLVTALRALPRRQREAVVLRHLLGFPEADAAAAMGCSVGTVKSSTSKALDALRRSLGPDWKWSD
jgi:RNA polymerase sigma factor (sigma-70 family)